MKTVHWPGRCPPLSSLNLNRLLGHASNGPILDASVAPQEPIRLMTLG